MNRHPRMNGDSNAYPDLNRAAGAGLSLVETRRHFRRLAREAMDAFADADEALRATGFDAERPSVYRGIDAAHSAFALFIARTEEACDDEDDYADLLAESPRMTGATTARNRLDDVRDGYLNTPEDPDFVEHVFNDCAREEFEIDRQSAKRLYCVALTWGVDLRHCREEPGWARRQGVLPGAEAAPSLASLLLQLAQRDEDDRSPRALALRRAAQAAGRIQAAAAAYGRACCAEFEYATILAESEADPPSS